MGYKEIISKIEAIEYSKYHSISSYEKLMVYVAYFLEEHNVPLTFNYLCIAAFKMFPETFCCDEEFKEFPSVDRLNRTLMHLKYVRNKEPLVTGTPENGYSLTRSGLITAKEVELILKNTKVDVEVHAPKIDTHKKGFAKDYLLFTKGDGYQRYLNTNSIDIMYIWEFFNVIPYTQMKKVKENMKHVYQYAKENNDKKCMEYITQVLSII